MLYWILPQLNPHRQESIRRPRMSGITAKQLAVIEEAENLMRKHGLLARGWHFSLDNAKVRAGICRYRAKQISLSKNFVEMAPAEEITDTILHEIAHALVNPRSGHNLEWKRMAIAIGCNGKRCHQLNFSATKFVQKCSQGCWSRPVHRRKKSLICKLCHAKVVYEQQFEEKAEACA